MAKSTGNINLLIFGLSLIALVWVNNDTIPLWNADEAAYAGFAKNMLESGDYISQDFYQADVHRKPPLHLWLISLSYAIFGINEWAVRFPSGLSVILSAFILFRWIKEERDLLTAQITAGIFVSNFLVLTVAKVAFVDAHLLLFSIISGFTFYKILQGNYNIKHVLILWIALGLGILTKGPQILIFFGLLFLSSFWIQPLNSTFKRLKPWWGLIVAFLPISLWAYYSYQKDGGTLLMWMWNWYIMKRAEGEVVFGQTGPPGYYLFTMIVAFTPFIVGIFLLIKHIIKKEWFTNNLNKYVLLWILSGWLIYELIPSKLPTYSISAYPGLAIAIAITLREVKDSDWKSIWMRLGIFIQLVLIALVSAGLIYVVKSEFGFFGLFLAILAGLTILIASIIYVMKLESGHFERSGLILVWGNILFCFLLVLPIMNLIKKPFECPKEVANTMKLEVSMSDKILLAKEDFHMVSLPFYLSLEGKVIRIPIRDEAIKSSVNTKYRAVVADSSFIKPLEEFYTPIESHSCFDMNTGKYNSYLVFYRK